MALTLNIILIGLGWLLAAGSGVLWFRENPGRRLHWSSPKPSWRSNALFIAGMVVTAYGVSNVHLSHYWMWLIAVVLPISVLAGVVPRIVRWHQLRRSATEPADPNTPVEGTPAV